jgi:DNA ligase-1
MNFPTLYKKTSTGKIQTWEIQVGLPNEFDDSPDQPADIVTTYGIKDGKMQVAVETIAKGKNIGKINETAPFEQACAEAKAQWEKKLKNKGYVQNLADAEAGKRDERVIGGVDPMLAHSYDKRGHDIRWPAYVQPKLDGHRCIAVIQNGVCTLWSRQRKKITGVPHINRALEESFGSRDMVIDGELYNHNYRDNFEELTSFIRQVTPKPGHEVVQYWMYDVISDDPFEDRLVQLSLDVAELEDAVGTPLVAVPTEEVESEDEMIAVFGAYIENGFEGLMVRNKAGKYVGKRSKDLQKVKMFQDAEFPIVGVEAGKGKMAQCAIFVCEAENGEKFNAKMKGKLDDLKPFLLDESLWRDKLLTVQFQKRSAEGLPIFPVGLRIREDV